MRRRCGARQPKALRSCGAHAACNSPTVSAVQTTVKSHCSLNILRAADLGKAKVCQAPWGSMKGLPTVFGLTQTRRTREIARSGASAGGARGEGERRQNAPSAFDRIGRSIRLVLAAVRFGRVPSQTNAVAYLGVLATGLRTTRDAGPSERSVERMAVTTAARWSNTSGRPVSCEDGPVASQ